MHTDRMKWWNSWKGYPISKAAELLARWKLRKDVPIQHVVQWVEKSVFDMTDEAFEKLRQGNIPLELATLVYRHLNALKPDYSTKQDKFEEAAEHMECDSDLDRAYSAARPFVPVYEKAAIDEARKQVLLLASALPVGDKINIAVDLARQSHPIRLRPILEEWGLLARTPEVVRRLCDVMQFKGQALRSWHQQKHGSYRRMKRMCKNKARIDLAVWALVFVLTLSCAAGNLMAMVH